MLLKWGILSAGKISNDFVLSLKYLSKEEHVITAIAASSKQRAVEFAIKHGIPKAYGSYEELAQDSNVDVVYIGSINTQHISHAKLMLENGKHVLCEKPLCLNYEETIDLIAFAETKKLFLMEAIWSRFFPVYKELKKLLAEGAIGDVYYLRVEFGVVIDKVPRVREKAFGGGVLLDIGVYVIQLANLVFGYEPSRIVAAAHQNDEQVDESGDYILQYPGGKTANLTTHSRVKLNNSAIIYGTKGQIEIAEPFWCPTTLKTPTGDLHFPLPDVFNEMYNYTNSAGLMYQAQEVRKCIMAGLTESSEVTHNESIALAKIKKEIFTITGVEMCSSASK